MLLQHPIHRTQSHGFRSGTLPLTASTLSEVQRTWEMLWPGHPRQVVEHLPSSLHYNRLILGMTGTTGAVYGTTALQFLRPRWCRNTPYYFQMGPGDHQI